MLDEQLCYHQLGTVDNPDCSQPLPSAVHRTDIDDYSQYGFSHYTTICCILVLLFSGFLLVGATVAIALYQASVLCASWMFAFTKQ